MNASQSRPRKDSGFSMVELLVLVAIIAILTVVAVSSYLHFRNKARTVEAKLGLHTICLLESAYQKEHDAYTTDLEALGFEMTGTPVYHFGVVADATDFTSSAVANLDLDATLDTWYGYRDCRIVQASRD